MRKPRLLAIAVAVCLMMIPALGRGAEKLTKEDFVFSFGEGSYRLGEEAQPLVDAIEASQGPMDMLEMDSCLFTGIDREFENDEIVLGTYPIGKDGADLLETIMIVGGSHRTPRGIGIGSTKEEVIAAYGSDFAFDYDQMTYALGKPLTEPVLAFVLDLQTNCVSAYYMMRNSS